MCLRGTISEEAKLQHVYLDFIDGHYTYTDLSSSFVDNLKGSKIAYRNYLSPFLLFKIQFYLCKYSLKLMPSFISDLRNAYLDSTCSRGSRTIVTYLAEDEKSFLDGGKSENINGNLTEKTIHGSYLI